MPLRDMLVCTLGGKLSDARAVAQIAALYTVLDNIIDARGNLQVVDTVGHTALVGAPISISRSAYDVPCTHSRSLANDSCNLPVTSAAHPCTQQGPTSECRHLNFRLTWALLNIRTYSTIRPIVRTSVPIIILLIITISTL